MSSARIARQATLLPECLDDYVTQDNPVRVIEVFIGYLNRIQSSRRLERETQRNIELMCLTGRLMPDFKTIADSAERLTRRIELICKRLLRRSSLSMGPDQPAFFGRMSPGL